MAEYIRFRLTSAKIGVTMALAALIGGVADRAQAQSQSAAPGKPAPLFVKLTGITGPVRSVLAKIEQKCVTLGNEIGSLEKKVRTDYYTKDQIGKVYLKDATANAEFLKKADTAANSRLLDSKPANAFVQSASDATVATGALSSLGGAGGTQTLLVAPGTNGEIIVVCRPAPVGQPAGIQVLIHNGTGFTLPAVQDQNGHDSSMPLAPGDTPLTTITGNTQLHLQTFPTSGFNRVMTLTVSGEKGANGVSVVGQMLNGDG